MLMASVFSAAVFHPRVFTMRGTPKTDEVVPTVLIIMICVVKSLGFVNLKALQKKV